MTTEEKFQYCIKIVLEHEGGLSNDKRDPGSTTKWGVSLRFLRTIGMDINDDGDITSEDIHALTKPGAIQIYRKEWWNKYKYDRFKCIEVVSKVFDLAVNMGSISSHKILQRSANDFTREKLVIDGNLGPKTMAVVNSLEPLSLRRALRTFSKERYLQILAENPNMEWARNGWINRAAW